MTEPDVYSELTTIFHTVFARGDLVLVPDMKAKDVKGWDSFKQIEIVLAVEARFGIAIAARDIDRMKSVGDLARIILAKTQPA